MKVTITFVSLKVIDNGDPNHETHGEIFYSFKVDGKVVASKSKTTPLKIRDGQTITLNKKKVLTGIDKTSPHITLDGYVGDKDSGFNGKNEFDTFRVFLTGRNKWKQGTNRVHLQDGRLRATLKYTVAVERESRTVQVEQPAPMTPTKSASVTIVSFEDSKFYNLIQNAHNQYGHAFDGYDKSVLIKLVYNEPKQPDKHVYDISIQSMLNELKALADDDYFIDLFIHSHGTCNKITFKNPHDMLPEHIASLATGRYAGGRFPLRMVYQINCNGSTLNDDWMNAGAKAVCGTAQTNFYPNMYNKFMREWNDGERFDIAIQNSNTASARTIMQILIAADARNQGFSCPPFKSVLNKARCAERYFTENWFYTSCDSYDDDISGKKNMNIASTMVIAGDANLRKTERNLSW